MPLLKIGDWLVDRASNQIRRDADVVHLEPKVVDLLLALARHPGQVVSRDDLLAEVWSGVVVGEDVLTQAVIKLRRALGDNTKSPVYIQTIPKRGYRLLAPVVPLEPDADPMSPRSSPAAPQPQPQPLPIGGPRRTVNRRWLAIGAASLVMVASAGWWLYSRLAVEAVSASLQEMAEAIARPQGDTLPSVAVRQFREVADDPVQALLARGITARLITDLGRFPDLRVLSLPDAAEPPPAGNESRGRDYVVSGEVQRSGDKVRLYVRLGDAGSGELLWSEQYDRSYTELLALQDELTREVLRKLRIEVSDAELRRRARPYTRNLEAYEYFLRAQSALLVRRKPENDAAREMYNKAIELDPAFSRARAGLALTYAADRRNGWAADGDASLARAFELARSAQQMDPDTPENWFALAFVNMERGDLGAAAANLRTALGLNPSYADAYALMGGIQTYRGRPQETIPLIRAAMRLRPESGHLYLMILGRACYFLGDTESAALYLRQALARNPESVEAHLYLAATLVAAGQPNEADWEAEQIRALEPAFNVHAWLRSYPMVDPGQRERLARALATLNM